MATNLKFSVVKSDDFTKLIVTESTGEKPAVSDGFGAPDMEVLDVTEVTISLLFPNETTPIASANLTNAVINTTFDLLPEQFGKTEFPDGYYNITETVTDGITILTNSKDFFFSNETECCVAKMTIADLKADCGCLEKQNLKPAFAKMYLDYASYAFYKCNQKNNANLLIGFAKQLC